MSNQALQQRVLELEELVSTLQEENYFLRQRASSSKGPLKVVNHFDDVGSNKKDDSPPLRTSPRTPHGHQPGTTPLQDIPYDPDSGATRSSPEERIPDEDWFRFRPRAAWLIALLILQSTSSFVLASFKELIQKHPSIVYFLTMLVGAGGNAGGQAVVYAVRRLALGKPVDTLHQMKIGLLLGVTLSIATAARTAVQQITSFHTGCALSGAMFFIVVFAVAFGTLLPQLFQKVGIDPAHATATIQVGMDIFGICIACLFATVIYELTEDSGHIIPPNSSQRLRGGSNAFTEEQQDHDGMSHPAFGHGAAGAPGYVPKKHITRYEKDLKEFGSLYTDIYN
ncbi:unnamed protein product [Amoebophrya sp. A120]|nr:unnamed protein product [Amoebophrya sp. A120]|eukprot:GSA120T00013095001.1